MWWKKHQWKVITAVVVVAILAAAFWFGGNAPGSTGLDFLENDPTPAVTDSVPPATEPAQEPVPETPAAPTEEPATEPTEEPTQEPTAVPTEEPTQGPTLPTPEPAMEIDPETGKDPYLTDPVPEGKPTPVEPEDVQISDTAYTCTISISCATILDNMDLCDPEKAELVPEDGWILKPVTVTFYEGESVFNVLQRTCKQQKIHMEYENTPIYNSAYIEGIHNLYEFDVGELSGWMYQVNDWFPNYGCSRYRLQDGDVICWVYTCDLGDDVGGGYAAGR